MSKNTIKIVILGSKGVGKSSILRRYIQEEFAQSCSNDGDLKHDFEEKCKVTLEREGKFCEIEISEGNDKRLPRCDVFLVCFAVDSLQSFNEVQFDWMPLVRRHAPATPTILLATKTDLRETAPPRDESSTQEENNRTLGLMEGAELCQVVMANKYLECSALSGHNIEAVFDEAIAIAVSTPEKRSKSSDSCTVC